MLNKKFFKHSFNKLLNLHKENPSKETIEAKARIIYSLRKDVKNQAEQKVSSKNRNIDNQNRSNDPELLNHFDVIARREKEKILDTKESSSTENSKTILQEQAEMIILYSYVLNEIDLESLEKLIGSLPQYLKDKLNAIENEKKDEKELAEVVNDEIERMQNEHYYHIEEIALDPLDMSINLFNTVLGDEDIKDFADKHDMHKECAELIKYSLKGIEENQQSTAEPFRKYHPEIEEQIKSFAKGLNRDPKLEPIITLLTIKIQNMKPEERKQFCDKLLSIQEELEKTNRVKHNTQRINHSRSVSFQQ